MKRRQRKTYFEQIPVELVRKIAVELRDEPRNPDDLPVVAPKLKPKLNLARKSWPWHKEF